MTARVLNPKFVALLLTSILITVAIVVAIFDVAGSSTDRSTKDAPRVILDADMFLDQSSARSLQTLIRDSDMIVVGQIDNAQLVQRPQSVEIPIACWTPTRENADKVCSGKMTGDVGYYLTNYKVHIERYLKGGQTGSQEVIDQEMGGMVDGVQIVFKDWPWYEVGKRYLMFLKWDNEKPGIAYTTAAALGGYPLDVGGVQRFPEAAGYQGGAPAALDALTEDNAIGQILSIVSRSAPGSAQ